MTTESEETEHGSEIGYYLLISLSFLNSILFTLLLIRFSCLPQRYRNPLLANKYAILLLVFTIIQGIVALFTTELIINFDSSCYESECSRCTVIGYMERFVSTGHTVSLLLALLQFIKINFQPFPVLAYPKAFIKWVRIFIILAFIAINLEIWFISHLQYKVSDHGHDSLYVCQLAQDHDTHLDVDLISTIFGAITATLVIILCLLCIRKACQLYSDTENQIKGCNDEEIYRGVAKLRTIVKPCIRHALLVITILISTIVFQVTIPLAHLDGVSFYLIDSLIASISVVMMFPLGFGCFKVFCGCFERVLIKQWMKREAKALEQQKVKSELNSSNPNSSDNNNNKDSIKPSSDAPIQLESINEDNQSINQSMTILPSFSDQGLWVKSVSEPSVSYSMRPSYQQESFTNASDLAAISGIDV